MSKVLTAFLVLAGLVQTLSPVSAQSVNATEGFPLATVPDGLGVNIHFTGAPARDLDMLRQAGFKFVRMDLTWRAVEARKGVYDFRAYDALTAGLEERGIRPLYILDYGNPLYETEQSVRTEVGREAFARFAATAAAHYRGKGVIWEIWNEPNRGFWKPRPNADEYMALVRATIPAMRKADPSATIIAPATSRIAVGFLSECFREGLLTMVNAVSVHPYRLRSPESVVGDIAKLRLLMERYSSRGSTMPIISSEWGYPVFPGLLSATKQGNYLARMFLVNLSLGIPLSIWYDWHNDGTRRFDMEHNFGTVTYDYRPKPAYAQMQRLVAALTGFHFVRRLPSSRCDWLLLFRDKDRSIVAAWTTGLAHRVELNPNLTVRLTGDPLYIPIDASTSAE